MLLIMILLILILVVSLAIIRKNNLKDKCIIVDLESQNVIYRCRMDRLPYVLTKLNLAIGTYEIRERKFFQF